MSVLHHFELMGRKVVVDSNEIHSNGTITKLTPKEKEVLLVLYDHRGSTVSRSYLLETVWGDPLGNDSGLSQAISKLRQVFRDDPKHPVLIKTIPKLGYQLLEDNRPLHTRKRKGGILRNFKNLSGIKKFAIKLLILAIFFTILMFFIDVRIQVRPQVALSNFYV
ncbi:helix-turn-helix domain-containing protein [Aureisphaera galaxeae]|uniref:winged helix-turn-helix domain-containing protein n=1 Tax=Aureisphaera galaxeae TaxID=1538023 RepID=UPI002350DB11|nr:helix-turn-helix domain-containing protein [Aureisphaera galaxeae]MDC8002493.1 helix-turn-helix domain-containing protein [Aureisphaera galaxeae]